MHLRQRQQVSMRALIPTAAASALHKLDPRTMVHNPVMFVTEVGSAVSTYYLVSAFVARGADVGFLAAITVWLWFTVLFANFAEATAEGRGKAQADSLRRMKTETMANRLVEGRVEQVPATQLHRGDVVVVSAGEIIPGDGEVIEGIASVDESAMTGESAPVIRESGGDRSAVTGGTKVLSDQITVRISSEPGQTYLDRMIALVEGAARHKTPNEIALSILLAGLTHALSVGGGDAVDLRAVLAHYGLGDGAARAASVPDPDHDRGAAFRSPSSRRSSPPPILRWGRSISCVCTRRTAPSSPRSSSTLSSSLRSFHWRCGEWRTAPPLRDRCYATTSWCTE